MLRKILAILIALVVLWCFPATSKAQSTYLYRYAYLAITPNNETQLHLVDPTSSNEAPHKVDLALVPREFGANEATASPTGEWIAIGYGDSAYRTKRILRVVSLVMPNQSQELLRGVTWDNLAWSPDGLSLAWIEYPGAENPESALRVYSTVTGKITTLLSDHRIKHFIWSPDHAPKIALSTALCTPPSYTCTFNLSIMNVNSPNIEKAVALSDILHGFGSPSAVICDPHWSLDGRFISFVSECDTGTTKTLQDVFIWDTVQNSIRQVTHFTDAAKAQGGDYTSSGYQMAWADEQTLMVGVITYSSSSTPPATKTIFIFAMNGAKIDVSTAAQLEYKENPVSNEWAFRSIPAIDGAYWEAINPSVQIAAFDGNRFISLFNGPNGCDLAWSLDGEYLAFSERDRACLEKPQTTGIFSVSGRGVAYYPISTSYRYTLPIGWVLSPQNSAPNRISSPQAALTNKLSLTALCTSNPNTERYWRIHNPNPVDVLFTWHVYGTKQKGSGIVKANSDAFLQTVTYDNINNILRIFTNGKQQAVKVSESTPCERIVTSPQTQ